MRFPQRTYSVATNTCVILSVASAFGFDQTGHIAWLALGGSAALVAVAMYFIQHWQAIPSAESTRPASLPANSLTVDPWTTPGQHNVVATWRAATERAPRSYYWKTKERKPAGFSHLAYAVYKRSDAVDPADMVLGIIRQLQATDKAYQLMFATDGSITLRIGDDVEQPQASDLPQRTAISEVIH